MTVHKPMHALLTPNQAASSIHDLIDAAARELLHRSTIAADTALFVQRGGALLERALADVDLFVAPIWPRTVACVGHGGLLPQEPTAAFLLCDVIMDSGKTMLDCIQMLRASHPQCRVEIFAIIATPAAVSLLYDQVAHMHVHSVLGRSDSFTEVPLDIPYDFGDVAEMAGLSRPHPRPRQADRP